MKKFLHKLDELAAAVAYAAEAVKGLHCAPIELRELKKVRSALDYLPRSGWDGNYEAAKAAQKLAVSSLMIGS